MTEFNAKEQTEKVRRQTDEDDAAPQEQEMLFRGEGLFAQRQDACLDRCQDR